jgi:hypothetical protein
MNIYRNGEIVTERVPENPHTKRRAYPIPSMKPGDILGPCPKHANPAHQAACQLARRYDPTKRFRTLKTEDGYFLERYA